MRATYADAERLQVREECGDLHLGRCVVNAADGVGGTCSSAGVTKRRASPSQLCPAEKSVVNFKNWTGSTDRDPFRSRTIPARCLPTRLGEESILGTGIGILFGGRVHVRAQ